MKRKGFEKLPVRRRACWEFPLLSHMACVKCVTWQFGWDFFLACGIQDLQICDEMLCQNLIFQAQTLLLKAEFWSSLPLVLLLFSQIFSYFFLNCGSRNVGNNDEQSKEMVTWLHSHELFAIAEIQHFNSVSRSKKWTNVLRYFYATHYPNFREGKKIQVL